MEWDLIKERITAMRVSNRKITEATKDSFKSLLLETGDNTSSLYFMDALRLSRMLEKAALDDIKSKAVAMGADEASVEKLKKDVIHIAKATPIESFRISKACGKASKYLSDNVVKIKQAASTKAMPSLKPVYNREKYMQRFDAGFDNDDIINSNVPNIFLGKREDLDAVIAHVLDRCEINENCCLHLSLKTFNKKLNKNYKRVKPEDWQGRLKCRSSGGIKDLMAEGSKLKTLEVMVVDELSAGYGYSEKNYTSLKKAHMCFNNCTLSTCARGVVFLAFQEADSDDKVKDSEALSIMVDKSNYYECFSDETSVFVRDKHSNIVLTIPRK
jgi:hypothetical protein